MVVAAVVAVAVEEDKTVEAQADIDRSAAFACLLEERNLTQVVVGNPGVVEEEVVLVPVPRTYQSFCFG